jgi:predicted regulator of Ras-like GTPase activity (Roadblock/LC7/MglB family)
VTTTFTSILQRVIDRVPGSVGAIFADVDGEAVDQVATDRREIQIIGAHYGIILNHVQSALHLFHYGSAEELIVHHGKMDLVIRAVGHGYYIVLAVEGSVHLAIALREIAACANALRAEMY